MDNHFKLTEEFYLCLGSNRLCLLISKLDKLALYFGQWMKQVVFFFLSFITPNEWIKLIYVLCFRPKLTTVVPYGKEIGCCHLWFTTAWDFVIVFSQPILTMFKATIPSCIRYLHRLGIHRSTPRCERNETYHDIPLGNFTKTWNTLKW